ncbi:MAG: DNA polymerase III subunit delta [bacterium]
MLLKPDEFWAHIERGKVAPFYFFHGENSFLIKDACEQITTKLLGQEYDEDQYLSLYADEVSINELMEMASTYSFIPGARLIVYKGVKIKDIDTTKKIEKYLRHPMTDTSIIMIAEEKVAPAAAFLSLMKKEAVVVQFYKLFERHIPRWIMTKASSLGYKISPPAAQLLMDITGTDLFQLDGEIQKLCLYCGDTKEIDLNTIKKAIGLTRIYNIFELVGCIGKKDAAGSLRIIQQLLEYGEHPLVIVSTIYWYFSRLYKTKSLLAEGVPSGMIAQKVGVSPLFLKEYIDQANLFSEQEIHLIFPRLLNTDTRLKQGRIPGYMILQSFIFQVCFD